MLQVKVSFWKVFRSKEGSYRSLLLNLWNIIMWTNWGSIICTAFMFIIFFTGPGRLSFWFSILPGTI